MATRDAERDYYNGQCPMPTGSGRRCQLMLNGDQVLCGVHEAQFARRYMARWQSRMDELTEELARALDRPRAESVLARLPQGRIEDGFDPRGFFVYLLWGNDQDTPLYVGRSTNVLRRTGQHMAASYSPDIRRVTFIRCATEKQMHRIETELIRRYHPRINIAQNIGFAGQGVDRR